MHPASLIAVAPGSHVVTGFVVVAGVAVFLGAIAALGRWAAATHPEPEAKTPRAPASEIAPEILAAISASVSSALGPVARIASIEPAKEDAPATVSVEALYLQWSIEGRRQIYSSHKFR